MIVSRAVTEDGGELGNAAAAPAPGDQVNPNVASDAGDDARTPRQSPTRFEAGRVSTM